MTQQFQSIYKIGKNNWLLGKLFFSPPAVGCCIQSLSHFLPFKYLKLKLNLFLSFIFTQPGSLNQLYWLIACLFVRSFVCLFVYLFVCLFVRSFVCSSQTNSDLSYQYQSVSCQPIKVMNGKKAFRYNRPPDKQHNLKTITKDLITK